jgi:hypothetical protein
MMIGYLRHNRKLPDIAGNCADEKMMSRHRRSGRVIVGTFVVARPFRQQSPEPSTPE